MTIKELSKYHDIKVEVDDLQRRIYELETTIVKASKYSDTKIDKSITNTSPTEELAIKLNKLRKTYVGKQLTLTNELEKIEEYLNTINDSEIRTIMRKRFIDLLTWEEVANVMHYSNPVPYYKVRKYLGD